MKTLATATVLAAIAATSPAETRVVERVLAVADGRPVLLSEVRAAALVRGEETGPALESMIDEILMFAAASRMPQAAVTADEEERALKVLLDVVQQGTSGGTPDVEALRRMARRQAVILKYVDFRFRPQVRIAEEDVAAALRTRGEDPSSVAEEAAAEARRALEAEDLDRRIEAWVADLRREARIRYNPVSGTAPATR